MAVSEVLHSSQFDPFNSDIDQLKKVAKQVYSKYSPIACSEFVNPLGGELGNYLIDGESRIGYLVSYIRASSMLMNVKRNQACGEEIFKKLKSEFINVKFDPFVSHVLNREKRVHPMPGIKARPVTDTGSLLESCYSRALWDYYSGKSKQGVVGI